MARTKKKQKKSTRTPQGARPTAGETRVGTLTVTAPNGQRTRVPDDGRTFPPGTMISYDVVTPRGHREMRWCVVGGGWPFDD
jgi:hypothetical protein